jgi:hypothetical protein
MLDLPTKTEKQKATVSVAAWQIKFRKAAKDVPAGAIEIREPCRLFAEMRHLNAAVVLADATPRCHDSFMIVWVPPTAEALVSIERDAEAWVHGGHIVGNRTVVRAGVLTVRVFWTSRRALIYATPENISSALDAVVRFTVAQLKTIALEKEMGSTWAAIEADSPLTLSIATIQQRQQSHADAMTLTAIRMKATFLRITRALEQLDPLLEESSKRIYAELVLAGGLYDRLELIEDPVQFALEHYESANTRLNEARFAYKEQRRAMISHALEAAIVFLLLYPLHLFW